MYIVNYNYNYNGHLLNANTVLDDVVVNSLFSQRDISYLLSIGAIREVKDEETTTAVEYSTNEVKPIVEEVKTEEIKTEENKTEEIKEESALKENKDDDSNILLGVKVKVEKKSEKKAVKKNNKKAK